MRFFRKNLKKSKKISKKVLTTSKKFAKITSPRGTGHGAPSETGKTPKSKKIDMKNAIIAHVGSYNHRRFSCPWVCKMESNGDHNFDDRIGVFTGDRNCGSAGDLVIFEPVTDQVYGYGQKDYRGNRTEKNYARWDGEKFVPCDKLGREIA